MSAQAWHSQSFVGALLGAAFSLVGCDDSLKSVSLIEETRVLGARVEVESEPTRSSPNPGERATVRLFVAAPSEPANLSYALSVCAVSPVNTGFPNCGRAPFASTLQAEPGTAAPSLDFQVPTDLDLAATPHGFASALVCPGSSLEPDENGRPSCTNGPGLNVNFEFDLGGPDSANHSPSITADALTFDGQPWLASEATTCPGDLLGVSANSKHALAITLSDTDFEPLPQTTSLEPGREALLVSQFSTAGKLSHAFVSLKADTQVADRTLSWDAPAANGEAATLVRFYYVVRDARGGEDFATRALCISP
ncbi:MAG: hypothetical protein ABW061_22750 [Polyangiaceae bacterium]